MEKVAKEARCMECMTAFGGGAVRMCLDVIHTDSTARHFRVGFGFGFGVGFCFLKVFCKSISIFFLLRKK